MPRINRIVSLCPSVDRFFDGKRNAVDMQYRFFGRRSQQDETGIRNLFAAFHNDGAGQNVKQIFLCRNIDSDLIPKAHLT